MRNGGHRARWVEILLVAVAVFVCLSGSVRAQGKDTDNSGRLRAVQTSTEAFLPGTPVMIAAARVVTILPNPRGRYVLMVCEEESLPPAPAIGQPTTGGVSLFLYDAVARRTRTLWEQSTLKGARRSRVTDLAWLKGTNKAVATVSIEDLSAASGPDNPPPPSHAVLFVDAERDAHARALLSGLSLWEIEASPSSPVVAITEHFVSEGSEAAGHGQGFAVRFLNERGKMVASPPLPEEGYIGRWNEDDSGVYVSTFTRAPKKADETGDGEMLFYWINVDASTGAITRLKSSPKRPGPVPLKKETDDTPLLPIRTVSGKGNAAAPDNAAETIVILRPLYLQSTDAVALPSPAKGYPAFLAPHADEAFVLTDLSAVVYKAQNTVYAVPLTRLPLAQFADAQQAAWKQQTMTNAKQIGLALINYLQDHDEKFPVPEGLTATLEPYIINSAIFNDPTTGKPGFTYLLTGEVGQASMDSVATTPLGYLSGPGGRAMLYADGHVKWEGSPQKTPPSR